PAIPESILRASPPDYRSQPDSSARAAVVAVADHRPDSNCLAGTRLQKGSRALRWLLFGPAALAAALFDRSILSATSPASSLKSRHRRSGLRIDRATFLCRSMLPFSIRRATSKDRRASREFDYSRAPAQSSCVRVTHPYSPNSQPHPNNRLVFGSRRVAGPYAQSIDEAADRHWSLRRACAPR